MLRRRALVKLCALGLLTACAPGEQPPLPTRSSADRQAAFAHETEVARQVTATAEVRAATATTLAIPTATATPPPPTPTPTPRPPTATPPAAAAKIHDFKMAAYHGQSSLGGDEVRLSTVFSYGLPVVVNFWAPLCGPCRTEMPAFQRVSDEFAGRVYFLGVDVSPYWPGFGNREEARSLIRETAIRYPVTYAIENPLQPYGLYNLPATYFFTPDGRLLDRVITVLSEDQLRETVGRLLTIQRAGEAA